MKKLLLLSVSLLLLVVGNALAGVSLNVDAAPNVYGSPNYAAWEAATFQAVADGTFVNMSNGINSANIGTTNFEIQDEVVYSFGDLGKRLTWIYYIDGETVESLTGTGRFQISLINKWNGDPDLDFYDDYYGQTWLEPTKWENYGNGVIGTAGMAWWGAYNTNTQAELDSDIADWIQADETWVFTAKLDGAECNITSVREGVPAVPAPGAILLGSMGVSFVGWLRRRKSL